MRFALLVLPAAVAVTQQPDARAFVRRSVEANGQNWKVARNHTFLERIEHRRG